MLIYLIYKYYNSVYLYLIQINAIYIHYNSYPSFICLHLNDYYSVFYILITDNNQLVHLNSFSKISLPRLFWIELSNISSYISLVSNSIQDAKGLQRTNIAKRMALL